MKNFFHSFDTFYKIISPQIDCTIFCLELYSELLIILEKNHSTKESPSQISNHYYNMPLSVLFVALCFSSPFYVNIFPLRKQIFHANGKDCYSVNNTELTAVSLPLSFSLLMYKMHVLYFYLS